jgi:hypothetical protein
VVVLEWRKQSIAPGLQSAIGQRRNDLLRRFLLGLWIGRSIAKERITESEHIEAVAADEPSIAVAPDITDGREGDYSVADELLEYADTVIVVPKAMPALNVPERFRVGIPCQKRFGPVPPRPIWEYQQVDEVHLLGGSPKVQSDIAGKIGKRRVKSLDTASPIAASSRGKVWGRPFKNTEWYDSPERGYYQRIESSLNNLLHYHNSNVETERIEWIKERIEIPTDPTVDPLTYLNELPPGQEELCLSENEEVPFPGRGYFYEDDALTATEWREKYR